MAKPALPSSRATCARLLALGLGLLSTLTSSQEAHAAVYKYTFSNGAFTTSQGPDPNGFFSGSFLWDDQRKVFTEWQLEMYSGTATNKQLLYTFTETNTGAGCFSSPLQSGNKIPNNSTFISGIPESSACSGNPDLQGNPTEFAVYQQVPYTVGNTTYNYSYFRLLLSGTMPNLQIITVQAGQDYLGWSVLPYLPSGTCSGTNALNFTTSSCPFAGNTQNNQNIRPTAITTSPPVAVLDPFEPDTNIIPTAADVPGPLPLLGGAAAFGWSRRLRRRLHSAQPASSN